MKSKLVKQQEAKERDAYRATLTPQQQLQRLKRRGANPNCRESIRLTAQIIAQEEK